MRSGGARDPRRVAIGGAAIAIGLACAAAFLACRPNRADEPGYRVFALEYGRSDRVPKASFVRDAPADATTALSWSAWIVYGRGRVILVDTGFDDDSLAKRWKVARRRSVPDALRDLDFAPADVTDVVLSHVHWDHAGNLGPFSSARVWVQRREVEWAKATVSTSRPERAGVRHADVRALERSRRLREVDGDAAVSPGVTLHLGGAHTPGSQWVEIETGRSPGTIVLAADAAYFFENVERDVPIAQTSDPAANLEALARMRRTASRPGLVVPGHDPAVFHRFRGPTPRCVEIR